MLRVILVSCVSIGCLLLAVSSASATNDVDIDLAGDPLADITDWADEFCLADDVCEDYGGDQRDAKGACIASNHATIQPATHAYLRFDFNITSITGANTVDGCWLVDVNQNGTVDRALCFSLNREPVAGNPLQLSESLFYTCNDSSATACGGDVVVTPNPAQCAINRAVGTADQILTCPADSDDTAVECSIPLVDLGWASGEVVLLSSCTSTSAQPNSSTFDCLADVDNPFVIDPEDGSNTPVELISFVVE